MGLSDEETWLIGFIPTWDKLTEDIVSSLKIKIRPIGQYPADGKDVELISNFNDYTDLKILRSRIDSGKIVYKRPGNNYQWDTIGVEKDLIHRAKLELFNNVYSHIEKHNPLNYAEAKILKEYRQKCTRTYKNKHLDDKVVEFMKFMKEKFNNTDIKPAIIKLEKFIKTHWDDLTYSDYYNIYKRVSNTKAKKKWS